MFTGIITDIGEVRAIEKKADTDYVLTTSFDTSSIALGASIACDGCCLTATETGADWFRVSVSNETLSKTTLGGWSVGRKVNLERALKLGDELGGHMVLGHIDGVAELVSITPEAGSYRLVIEAPDPLHRYIAAKGSVALDGISLTVNHVEGQRFGVNIIPHTWTNTNLFQRKAGDRINLEIDVLARYVQRLRETL